MNKISNEAQMGTLLLDEISSKRQFNAAKKKLEQEMYGEYFVNTRRREAATLIREEKRFLSHPHGLTSDTDSSTSSSSTKVNSSTNLLQRDLECLYQSKLQERTRVRRQASNLTQPKGRNTQGVLEESIGDSNAVKPKKTLNLKSESNLKNYNLLESHKNLNQGNRNILTDSIFEKKFQLFVEKSLHIISDIRSLLEKGIDPPDGDEDISRRLLRVKEFSNRFSRNYLYPINRQLEELNKVKSPSSSNPNQKLLTAYQTVLHGLQAYLSHLPTSIGGCSSEKLKLLLKQLIELLDIHNKIVIKSEEGNYGHLITNFRLNTELTLQKIDNHFTAASSETVLKANATKISLNQKKAKTLKQKSRIEERLSMYNTTSSFRRDALWKKTALSLTKKNTVKSRYKTAGFKHRPPREPDEVQILQLPSKCKLFPKRSSMVLKETPHFSPPNEDNIVTMVEVEEKSINEDENKKEEVNHEELVVKLLQLVLDNNRKKENKNNTSANEEKITDILNKLHTAVDGETLQKIADGLQKNKHLNGESLAKLNILKQSESIEALVKKRKEPTITITGTKNAKLICIKDDNSVIESESEDQQKNKNRVNEEVPVKCVTSQTQTDINGREKRNKTTQRPSTNMKRLPKSSTKLETLPKEYAVSVIQYKLDFHKFCKNNSMYRKTTSIVPWKLMARLSDKIVDAALLNVAKEIKVNEIAERIFRSELQL